MKKITAGITIITFLFSITNLCAQSCEGYFPSKKGSILETTIYNDKGKKQGVSTLTVQDIQPSASKTVYQLHSEMKDEKDKPVTSADYEAYCSNNSFFMSMKSMVSAEQMKAWKDMEVTMKADDIEYPANPSPGQKLADAHLTVTTKMNGVKMPDFEIDITDRTVVGPESVTTAAGTFDCIKITAKEKFKNIFTTEMNSAEWIAKGIGVVKTESYKGDKKKSYTELTSLK